MTRWHDPGRAAKVAALACTGVFAALVFATPALAQETPAVIQAALVGIGYYLSNSPWLLGIGGFFGLYRPLVAGLFVGIIFGDPAKGAQIGAAINLLYIGFISAGGSIPADPSVAGWVGTALAMAGGLSAEAAISLGVAIGLLGTIIFFTRMSVDSFFAHIADAAAEQGDIGGVARANWVLPQIFLFVISFFPAFLAVYLGSAVVSDGSNWLNTNAPWVLKGFEVAGGLLPAIGIALNADRPRCCRDPRAGHQWRVHAGRHGSDRGHRGRHDGDPGRRRGVGLRQPPGRAPHGTEGMR